MILNVIQARVFPFLQVKSLNSEIQLYFCLFAFSRAAPAAYGGSQARGLIRAVAAGLHQSHSNVGVGSEPHLRPTPPLMAVLTP